MKRIADSINYAKLSGDPAERHEQLLECFGQDLLGLRNDALKGVYEHLERTSWERLLPYDRDFFSRVASLLSPEQREISRKLTERVITAFMERLMTMLNADAANQPLGEEHGIRYRLLAEIQRCPREKPTERYRRPPKDENLDVEDFEPPDPAPEARKDARAVVEQHDLTEGGKLHFPKYWHRWVNRYGSY